MKKPIASLTMLCFFAILMLALSGCQRPDGSYEENTDTINDYEDLEVLEKETLSLDDADIYEMYAQAMIPLTMADSFILYVTTSIHAESQGADILSMAMNGRVYQIDSGETGPELKLNLFTVLPEMSMPVLAFYRNGMYYVDMGEIGIKMPLDFAELAGQSHVGIGEFSVPEYSILNRSGVQLAEGGYRLTFSLAASAVHEMIEREMKDTFVEANNLTFHGITLEAALTANRELASVLMDIDFSMETEGQVINVLMITGATIEQVGGVVIDFPDRLANFFAVDSQIMTLTTGLYEEQIAQQ